MRPRRCPPRRDDLLPSTRPCARDGSASDQRAAQYAGSVSVAERGSGGSAADDRQFAVNGVETLDAIRCDDHDVLDPRAVAPR